MAMARPRPACMSSRRSKTEPLRRGTRVPLDLIGCGLLEWLGFPSNICGRPPAPRKMAAFRADGGGV
ncbi:hypothetical protein E2562_006922 [Oryza meyeriana var. granulata]|uniref:Uncharacterized protein n=1 Tax=Oryza meyeriana var. granulata TaxID=110450 RepID=A0A6G1BJA6_9ORYZ|nr:hypothetical protein E2562_006922 [Oryza meyeriana var. granulata]